MPWLLVAIPLAWLAFALFSRWLLDNPREDVEAGLLWRFCRRYARRVQRVRWLGTENRPESRRPGPLIVISNHSSGVDAALLIAAFRFEARWVMARDMRYPFAEGFWEFANVIMVDRQKREAAGLRDAIDYVTSGGVVGIFPEGGIERPQNTLRPFNAGVGLLVRRTGAPILPVVIQGTSYSEKVWKSYWLRGHATVEFKPWIRYTNNESAQDIATDLLRRYQEWTGWPVVKPASDGAP